MNPVLEHQLRTTRRQLLSSAGTGIGAAALASLIGQDTFAGTMPAVEASPGIATSADSRGGLPELPHLSPKIKNVIYLFQNGAPTHVDLFDFKPQLSELHGQPVPTGFVDGKRFSTMTGDASGKLMLAPVEPFHRYGDCGAPVSDFMPHTAQVVDKICFIKSMHTDAVNHAPAISFLLSGSQIPGRPTLGAWLNYGLGNEAEDLPAFVVMTSISKNTSCGQIFYDFYWGSGFLPSQFQGVKFRSGGDPVLYLSNPKGVTRKMRRGWLDDLAKLNHMKLQQQADPEITTRISQYEMGFKMQASVPELTDVSGETKATLDMYGPSVTERGTFAHNCLLARRLVERGTRFVQLMHAGWDQHNSLTTELYTQCKDTDQPSAALVRDLEQRGLLDETLIVWGGEFGRTPFLQGDINNRPRWGRDHHPYAFTIWMAGGGVKSGMTFGASDELGINVAQDGVHVHDLQATILHLLGIDHERLTYRFQGRQFRLTDVHGEVVHSILG
ncbi:MAG TPA: DUF1501 domain-containing protein [Planctomycetes bacterium]|nr:DUF1501 domain-containing protein [Fuerstiella sp.]HIK90655.1 DUF1501 domain-containing protein [Planctomycetota bacterium]